MGWIIFFVIALIFLSVIYIGILPTAGLIIIGGVILYLIAIYFDMSKTL